MDDENLIGLLRNMRLFSSLTDAELSEVVKRTAIKKYKRNSVILHEVDTNEFMYMVLSGKVKVTRSTEEGKETILALHGAGEFFGEVTLIDGKTTRATVSAMEDSLIVLISREDFNSLLTKHENFLNELLLIFCSRLRDSWSRIEMLNLNNAAQRIKMLLLMLSEESGTKTPEGVTLDMRLTHQNIADMTGLTRETVSRILEKWAREKAIDIGENRRIRLNPGFLKKDFKNVI
jgi:CRP/FNR family transcriptional regulator